MKNEELNFLIQVPSIEHELRMDLFLGGIIIMKDVYLNGLFFIGFIISLFIGFNFYKFNKEKSIYL